MSRFGIYNDKNSEVNHTVKKAKVNPAACDRSPFCPVVRVCPVGAVSMSGGFFNRSAPVVDPDKCIGCGKCVTVCPHGAVTMKE